ncbi:MAG: 3'-5' exonuclease domain-containing protein 2 [Cyclobacteriaceae bacterium]|nr:3'-5' exonuclease domain-containing protein 2 [Cyclobacteriaceae bacterium]MCH8515945.1 3'-5' exonuclease domain-containing protein 2 [Cyclobacteriaceae bacterium]
MFQEKISKEEVRELPIIRFEGPIDVIDHPAKAIEVIRKEILQHRFLGFDTETRPSFRKGNSYALSLVQISSLDKSWLFRVKKCGWPGALIQLMESSAHLKIGVSLRDDLKEVRQSSRSQPKGFIDMNDIAAELSIQNQGARNLSGIFLGYRISKSQQTTNWDREQLTEPQLRYAATDAWICLKMFDTLMNKGYVADPEDFML